MNLLQIIKKQTIARDYVYFASIIISIMLLMVFWVGFSSYHNQINQRTKLIEDEARKIDQNLTESFDYIFYLMEFLGNQISNHGSNPEYINALYSGFKSDFKVKNLSSWSMFDWINLEKHITITSTDGILKVPVDLSKRPNLAMAQQEPGKIFINDPDIGVISKQWIIPASMAVEEDKTGKILGFINIGIAVPALTDRISRNITSGKLRFAILTEKKELIAQSPTNIPKLEKNIFSQLDPSQPEIVIDGITYLYFYKSYKYPYIIAVGFDHSLENTAIFRQVLMEISPILMLGILSAILLYQFRRKIIFPIIELSDIANNIAKGDFNAEIPPGDNVETSNLSNALWKVKMLIKSEQEYQNQLIAAHQEIKEANSSLDQKVKQRTLELEGALQAKDEFLNNMSHEIKIPIGCIKSMSNMMIEDWKDMQEQEKKEGIAVIYENTNRLFNLLSNMLDLSKSKLDKLSYNMSSYDLSNIIKSMIDEQRHVAASKGIKLSFYYDESQNYIAYIDVTRIEQVIRNLISNALKFTNEGSIEIFLERIDGDMLQIKIEDSGVGIPENEVEEIFEPFTQSSSTNSKAGGTGLGLSICKEIINAHKGNIWAENNASNGAIFYVNIPSNITAL